MFSIKPNIRDLAPKSKIMLLTKFVLETVVFHKEYVINISINEFTSIGIIFFQWINKQVKKKKKAWG